MAAQETSYLENQGDLGKVSCFDIITFSFKCNVDISWYTLVHFSHFGIFWYISQ